MRCIIDQFNLSYSEWLFEAQTWRSNSFNSNGHFRFPESFNEYFSTELPEQIERKLLEDLE